MMQVVPGRGETLAESPGLFAFGCTCQKTGHVDLQLGVATKKLTSSHGRSLQELFDLYAIYSQTKHEEKLQHIYSIGPALCVNLTCDKA